MLRCALGIIVNISYSNQKMNSWRVLTKLSNYFVCMPICDSRLYDALLPFPSDGLLVTRLLTCSDAHKLRRNEL